MLKQLRMLGAMLSATVTGALTLVRGGAHMGDVELKVGDRAPDFSLRGSDGTTYRLHDLIGKGYTVVVSWFPKAFTGG